MKRIAFVLVCLSAGAPVSATELSLLAGGGVLLHTDGLAWQVNAIVPNTPHVRVHLTGWEDNRALTAAYEFPWRRFHFAAGGGWVRNTTENEDITNRENVYLEVGYRFADAWRCQLTHLQLV